MTFSFLMYLLYHNFFKKSNKVFLIQFCILFPYPSVLTPLLLKAPCTGFEPASLLQPTDFKTAPSPPGHTAYFKLLDIISFGQCLK